MIIHPEKHNTTNELQLQIREGRGEAVRFLGLAKKPSGRVAKKLRDAGFAAEVIEAVLKSLNEDGYLDDQMLACRFVRQRRGRKAESKRALIYRMEQAGLDQAAIVLAVQDTLSDRDAAAELLKARFSEQAIEWSSSDVQSRRRIWQKLARFLAGRGFDSDICRLVMQEFFQDIDSSHFDQA